MDNLDWHNKIYVLIGCIEGEVRLVEGSDSVSTLQGRVEVCENSSWGIVCASGWDISDAIVACRQLGFSTAGTVYTRDKFSYNIFLNCNSP